MTQLRGIIGPTPRSYGLGRRRSQPVARNERRLHQEIIGGSVHGIAIA
jgi:hypothetical protein